MIKPHPQNNIYELINFKLHDTRLQMTCLISRDMQLSLKQKIISTNHIYKKSNFDNKKINKKNEKNKKLIKGVVAN